MKMTRFDEPPQICRVVYRYPVLVSDGRNVCLKRRKIVGALSRYHEAQLPEGGTMEQSMVLQRESGRLAKCPIRRRHIRHGRIGGSTGCVAQVEQLHPAFRGDQENDRAEIPVNDSRLMQPRQDGCQLGREAQASFGGDISVFGAMRQTNL